LGWEIKGDMHEGQMGHDYTFGLQGKTRNHWSINTSWSLIGKIGNQGSITKEKTLEGFTTKECNVDTSTRENPLHHASKHKLAF
jgi:hypothetical protein